MYITKLALSIGRSTFCSVCDFMCDVSRMYLLSSYPQAEVRDGNIDPRPAPRQYVISLF